MWRAWVLLSAILLTACAEKKLFPEESELARKLKPGCYTVDLFDPYEIVPPGPDVPGEMRVFLGNWKNGAWGGRWCHELIVTRVYADGRVELLDLYGPLEEHGLQATVFRRKGRISNGVLSFGTIGGSTAVYRRIGKYLYGVRAGEVGRFEITLSRDTGLASAGALRSGS